MISVFAEDEASAITVALHKAMMATEAAPVQSFVDGSMRISGTPILREDAATLFATLSVPTDTFAMITAAEVWVEGDAMEDALPPDEKYTFTACFDDLRTLDIQCVGTDSGRPIVTAILYSAEGKELRRQRENAFAGLHAVQYDGISYTVFVTSTNN
jgi:hypothetical protein